MQIKKSAKIAMTMGIAAALLLSTSTAALHAQDRDLQKELDALKAQINSLRAAINEQRVETKKNREKIRVVADRSIAPPSAPPGYTTGGFQPIGGFDDKKFHFGGITITPGGFVAAEGLYRSRATAADIGTGYNSIPTRNNVLGHTSETRFSARQSRLAMLVEANISPTVLGSGYFEGDFNSIGAGTNYTQTDSFVPRIRAAYANVDFLESGFHVTAGQMYSLMYLNSKGITPRNEVGPPTIDSGVAVGYLYARQPGVRLTKDFDKKLWLSVSAEESATTFGGTGCNNVVNNTGAAVTPSTIGTTSVTCLVPGGTGFGQTGQNQQLSLNNVPDIFGKIAYEARLLDRDIHIEGLGVYRNFYDRTGTTGALGTTSSNRSTSGFGVGGGLIVPLIPKRLDLAVTGLVGRGMGRYGSSNLPDGTLNADGSIAPLRNTDFNGTLTFHATPELDIYAVGGFEKIAASVSATGIAATPFVGYGIPTLSNAGCNTEGGTCAGVTGKIYELSFGMWDKFYQGSFGYFRGGVQYQYIKRTLLPGVGGLTASGDDHIVMTSLRYYPF